MTVEEIRNMLVRREGTRAQILLMLFISYCLRQIFFTSQSLFTPGMGQGEFKKKNLSRRLLHFDFDSCSQHENLIFSFSSHCQTAFCLWG